MKFEGRDYITIDSSDLAAVNFDEVMEASPETCRYSLDGAKVVLKFIPPVGQSYPESIRDITSKSQRYNWEAIIELMDTPEWSVADEEI